MKSNVSSINKMIEKFDNELKSLLLKDLKISKAKTNNSLNFSSQNKLRFA